MVDLDRVSGRQSIAMKPVHLLSTLLILGAAQAAPAVALEARTIQFDGIGFRLVELDLAHDRLELRWKDSHGNAIAGIEGLRNSADPSGRELLFAANAGIYDREYRPLGLHIENSRTLRPLNTVRGNASAGNFAIQPNGVFYVDTTGHAGVIATSSWESSGIKARLATQSGPMLVVDGVINPAFDDKSDSLKWRSGVCARTPGQVVFAVSQSPVSFHAFAQMFLGVIGCHDALYLDGTLSRIYTAQDGYAGAPQMMVKPYVGMFAVFSDNTPHH